MTLQSLRAWVWLNKRLREFLSENTIRYFSRNFPPFSVFARESHCHYESVQLFLIYHFYNGNFYCAYFAPITLLHVKRRVMKTCFSFIFVYHYKESLLDLMEETLTETMNIELNILSKWNFRLSPLCMDRIMFWGRRTVQGCLVATFNTHGQL